MLVGESGRFLAAGEWVEVPQGVYALIIYVINLTCFTGYKWLIFLFFLDLLIPN